MICANMCASVNFGAWPSITDIACSQHDFQVWVAVRLFGSCLIDPLPKTTRPSGSRSVSTFCPSCFKRRSHQVRVIRGRMCKTMLNNRLALVGTKLMTSKNIGGRKYSVRQSQVQDRGIEIGEWELRHWDTVSRHLVKPRCHLPSLIPPPSSATSTELCNAHRFTSS